MRWIAFTVVFIAACSPLRAVGAPPQHHRPHRGAATRAPPPEGSAEAAAADDGNGPPWRPAPGGGRHRHRRSGGRCAGAVGPWCGPYYEQRPVPFKPPRPRGAACPGGCSGVGVCHGDTGRCDCPAGWGGPSCADPDKRPCTNGFRLPRNSTRPKSHIGPDKRDLDWGAGGLTPSRCAGICDDDVAACYCDPQLGNPKYGRVPAPPGSPPGAPPLREGRPLLEPCSHPGDDGRGGKLAWGIDEITFASIYGPGGWCVADEPKMEYCGCRLDGRDGVGCNAPTEMFCLNQCSGRGRCRLGFCHCDAGWWGLDCAHAASEAAAAAAARRGEPPEWLEPLAVDAWRCAGEGRGCSHDSLRRGDEEWERRLRAEAGAAAGRGAPSEAAARDAEAGGGAEAEGDPFDLDGAPHGRGLWRLPDKAGSAGGAAGGDRRRRLRRQPAAPAGNSTAPPAARAPGPRAQPPGRLRPLVYVYDVPAPYVSRMLSYRMLKDACAWRWFDSSNQTVVGFFTYASETLLIELLLASPHRTLDPEEADFFFVPSLSACYLNPVLGWADHPWWYTRSFQRINHAVMMTHELLAWVKTAHPYWNRTGGADHIWHFAHDEGACWAPREVYDKSIILTHWGRLDREHTSGTSYGPDDYSKDVLDDPFVPGGFARLIKGHPCHTPGKDLVLPSFESPERYHASPYLGGPQRERDILLFHKGRMGERDLSTYSRGVRQKILALAKQHDWAGRYRIFVSGYDGLDGDYSEQLARSVFCLVAAGDGWTSRFDDAVLHGCIPVIVIDRVVGPWGHQLRWSAFSVRVAEADAERLPELLTAIPEARVRAMQRTLATVWRRFAWMSHPELHRQLRTLAASNSRAAEAAEAARPKADGGGGGGGGGDGNSSGGGGAAQRAQALHALAPGAWRDDAFHTLLQWLYSKLQQRGARDGRGGGGGNSSAHAEAVAEAEAGAEHAAAMGGAGPPLL
ncbi:exostosin-like glycosyltransferase [Raphidocelis subcapitata]|uniref:Exostosin-like glycosyltransferase n=1 Tax=Raphidocelis subcapitata TaxID=307507 RepID=A0A2V0NUF5_9CHLO|nr:exostosin-like glycosyltransferase [Raphidocelis subcapitata]|eukprot:GBF90959.1 exostosin-like glycosyltransferase [Raphidocelis subcapitata]